MVKVKGSYIIDNGPMFSNVAIDMEDGRTFFLQIAGSSATVLMMPDNEHYPSEVCWGRLPAEFQPHD